MSAPLLATKLSVPPQRPNLVSRPRLFARLDAALRQRHRLTLVSAKAGTGKTTLVSEWLHELQRPAIWLSLDGGDNDPRRFWSYLLAALQKVGIDIGTSRFEVPQLPSAEAVVSELINDVSSSAASFLLVLDDYHLIRSEWIHQAVSLLAEHQPPDMHLILIARVDPPLPLARMRGRGQITEIRDRDLRFTAEEATQFLALMQLELPVEAVSTLERRTEGWIVGLQMAAVSMRGRASRDEVADFVEAFGGTNRYILDYLTEEVLNHQPTAIQDFLMDTSILPRMCAELCDVVRFGDAELHSELQGALRGGEAQSCTVSDSRQDYGGRAEGDSLSILNQLERANLFVLPLDDERRWYRYHHLFADLVNSTLKQRRSAAEIRALHRRASRWHRTHGFLEEAMTHAIAAEAFEEAASMIGENIVSMLSRSEAPVLLGWIEKLPENVVRSHPWIDVYRANTLALSGRLEPIEPLLQGVEQRIEPGDARAPELLGHIAAIRAYTANLASDLPRAIEMAALAERHLPEGEHLTARGMVAYALAETHFACDNMDGASQASRTMLTVGEKTGRLLMVIPALCDLAAIRKVQGQLFQAEEYYHRARRWLEERRGLDSRVRCPYEAGLADLYREWNQLDIAHKHAATGVEYCERFGVFSLLVSASVTLMRILQAEGDVDAALRALRVAERTMQTYPVRLATRIELQTARVVQWLAVGDVETASHSAGELGGGSELEQIALARLCLAQGRPSDAQHLLDRQRASAQSGGRTGRLIEILGLQALALEAQSMPAGAEAALAEALSLARPEGYIRLFLDLGPALPTILERLAARATAAGPAPIAPIASDYVRDLLAALEQGEAAHRGQVAEPDSGPPSQPEGWAEPLTERELEVLHLLAEGLTNKAIADQLVVAPSTVKQHLKNIYGKLDVHSRTQAVARGRELQLL